MGGWASRRWLLAAALGILCARASQGAAPSDDDAQLRQLRRAHVERPDDFRASYTLAAKLHQQDHEFPDGGTRVPEAEQAYRAAIRLAPDQAVAATLGGNLGALLMSAGRLQEALGLIEQSIRDGAPEPGEPASEQLAGALFNRGKALSMVGREADAQAAFREALAAAQGVAPAVWTKACAALKQATAPELRAMQEAAAFLTFGTGIAAAMDSQQHGRQQAEARALRPRWGWLERAEAADRSWLHFALFAALDAEGSHGAAWGHLRTANALQGGGQAGEGLARDAQLLQALREVFRQPRAGAGAGTYELLLAGGGGLPDETPVFVVGMPRSGSTLVEQVLASHPHAFGAGEDTALAPLVPALLQVLDGQGGEVPLRAIADLGQEYVRAMRARVPQQQRQQQPARIVDKMLRNAWNVGYIAVMLPKAKVVWAVRHPMDVVLSCYAQPFEGRGTPWAWDLQDIARQLELTHAIMEHWERLLPGRVLKLGYEQLVAGQEAASRRLLAHVGLPWDARVLRFHDTRRDVQTASQLQVRRKLYKSSVGRWRRYEAQLAPVLQRLEPLVREYERFLSEAQQQGRPADEL